MKPIADNPPITKKRKFWTLLKDFQILLVFFLGAVGLLLSTLGFRQYYQNAEQPYTLADCFFQAVQLLSLNSGAVPPMQTLADGSLKAVQVPWALQIGRLLTPAVTFYTIIKILLAIFRDNWHLLRIRFMGGHWIICGLGRKGLLLARELRDQGEKAVVIERDPTNLYLNVVRSIGCKVVIGDAKDPLTLDKAGISRASALVTVCGSDNLNAEIAAQAGEIMKHLNRPPLTCTIHVEDPRLWVMLRELELTATGLQPVRLEFFNVFENGAYMLADRHLHPDDSQHNPALLVVGLGNMGESLVVNIARRWARRYKADQKKLKVLALDPQAGRICAALQIRFPLVQDVLDLVPLEMDTQCAEFHCGSFLATPQGECAITHAFVCLEEDTLCLNTALSLMQRLRNQAVQIIAIQWEDAGFSELTEKASLGVASLTSFGLLNHTCQSHLLDDGTHERLARAIHRVYRRTFTPAPGESIEGSAHMDWDKMNEGYRVSNRNQADDIGRKLAALGYRIRPWVELKAMDFTFDEENDVEPLAREEHIRWMNERVSQGWRYGEKRDNERKLHPDLLPWDDPRFSDLAKEKDRNTVRNIPGYLLEAGFQLEKIEKVEHS